MEIALAVVAMLVLDARVASANPAVSQSVCVNSEIVDEFGKPLHGNEPAAPSFGITAVEGDLVQILLATDNTIYPPEQDGDPDPRNVVLHTARIGLGTLPYVANPAKFGTSVSPRPGGNSKIFVRVFNAADVEDASFYGDSQLFTVKSWKNEVFLADIEATDKPLDADDTDGDGLSNSMERSLGSDQEMADSDGDGYNDQEEVIAGTDAMDAASGLIVSELRFNEQGELELAWESEPGRLYDVEFASASSSEEASFTTVATLQGEGGNQRHVLDDESAGGFGFYRVCVRQAD